LTTVRAPAPLVILCVLVPGLPGRHLANWAADLSGRAPAGMGVL